jgi:hypothetical protein
LAFGKRWDEQKRQQQHLGKIVNALEKVPGLEERSGRAGEGEVR